MEKHLKHLPKFLAAFFAVIAIGFGLSNVGYKAQIDELSDQLLVAQNTLSTNSDADSNTDQFLLSDEDKTKYEAKIVELQEQISLNSEEKSKYEANTTELQEQISQKQSEIDALWGRVAAAQQNLDDAYAKLDAYASASQQSTASASQNSNSSEGTSRTVYITKTGDKYHRSGCRYLSRSKISISLSSAQSQGYGACSVCGG